MAHTKERAVTLLHAHFNIPTITKATITGVAESDGNQSALEVARELLKCFPVAEIQHAATKLVLEDSEEVRLSLNVTVKLLKKNITELTADNSGLQRDNADLQKRVANLEKDNAGLKNNASALAADVENSDPNLAGCVASAAALDEEASKVKVKRKPGEGDQQVGVAAATNSSKRAKM